MAHSQARLNVNGRRLLVERVRLQGWPVAHAAKAMGLSRQCAHHWLKRHDEQADAGLDDRSSRPHTMPRRTSASTEQRVLAHRRQHRQGPASISAATGARCVRSPRSCAVTTCPLWRAWIPSPGR